MGWLITLGILVGLAVLPLGIRIRYNADGLLVKLIIGPIKIKLYPLQQKEKKEKKEPPQEDTKKEKSKPKKKAAKEEVPKEEKGGSWKDFLPLVKVALDFLGDLRRKLRLDNLYLRFILADSDPCDLAMNYGRTWAAVGSLMPALERCFVIKKRDVEVECDFTASETKIIAHIDVTITLGRLLALAAVYGIRALKEFLNIQNKRKGGTEK